MRDRARAWKRGEVDLLQDNRTPPKFAPVSLGQPQSQTNTNNEPPALAQSPSRLFFHASLGWRRQNKGDMPRIIFVSGFHPSTRARDLAYEFER